MRQYLALSVTTPAGTLQAAPLQTPWPMVDGHLRSLEVVIPSGHAGLTGIAATAQGTQIVPWAPAGFLVGDNTTIPIFLDYDVASSGLVVLTYNTGAYAHSHYLRAAVDTLQPPSVGQQTPTLPLSLPPVYAEV